MTALSVIVFAFDEAENVGPVLTELKDFLRAHEPDSEIVFVDDGSRDETLSAAKAALEGFSAVFVRHEKNRGIGAAIKSGVTYARGEWVTFMPADGQIKPEAITTLRRAAIRDRSDVVFSVYESRDDGLDRKVLSLGVRALIFAIHGVRMRSDGPYLFRRSLFDPSDLPPDSFFLNFEFPIRVLAGGRPTSRVTIECAPRRAGVSKSTGWKRIRGVAQELLDLRLRRLLGRVKPIT